MKTQQQTENAVLEKIVNLMDTAIRIPGTNVRFGLDALIGLIPGAGDSVSFIISGTLVLAMARKGISTNVALQMLGNIVIDYVIGIVPLLGDLFDVGFKANQRNLQLLKKYHDAHQEQDFKLPNVKKLLVLITTFLIAFLFVIGFVTVKLGELILGLF